MTSMSAKEGGCSYKSVLDAYDTTQRRMLARLPQTTTNKHWCNEWCSWESHFMWSAVVFAPCAMSRCAIYLPSISHADGIPEFLFIYLQALIGIAQATKPIFHCSFCMLMFFNGQFPKRFIIAIVVGCDLELSYSMYICWFWYVDGLFS